MATLAATAPRAMTTGLRKRKSPVGAIIGKILFGLIVVVLFIYMVFPFYWAVLSALKAPADITSVSYWPSQIYWGNLEYVFGNRDFLLALRNSAIVSVTSVAIALVLGAFSAYALGRMQFRGKSFVLYLILSMTMFPAIAILGALFKMVRGEWFLNTPNLYNTWWALIATYLTFTLPFTVWVLANFFRAMPGDLEQAALVDGATPFQAFRQILLPLALPGLVTTGLLAFIAAWNEFLFALTFTQDYSARTVQPAIASFSGRTQFDEPWGSIMAASVVVTVPLIVLVLIFQRKILAGLTAGAVKG